MENGENLGQEDNAQQKDNARQEEIDKLKNFVENIPIPSIRLQMKQAVDAIETPGVVRTMCDSVFTDFFGQKVYARDLCAELLGDRTLQEDEVEICTLQTTLIRAPYNDFSARIRDTTLVLTEEETQWNENIFCRLLMYLFENFQEILQGKNLHGSERVILPEPRLFVVSPKAPESLGKVVNIGEFVHRDPVQKPKLLVQIVREAELNTTLGQYLEFMKIWQKNMKLYSNRRDAILATINECSERKIMVTYLSDRSKEVERIMTDAMRLQKDLELEFQAERAKGRTEGRAEGRAEGEAKGIISTARGFGADDNAIVKMLMSNLHIDSAAAQQLLVQY